MQQEYREGVTVGELFGMIGKHIRAVIVTTVLFALAVTLLVAFVINPFGRYYSMEFYLSYPGSETMKYPDGSTFSYRELVSADALESVRSSDERFGSVDVGKMVEEDDVSITAEFSLTGETYVPTGSYTITVQGKYFSSRETAQAFIRKLAEHAQESIIDKAASIGYAVDEEVFADASYEDKIALMKEQRESIFSAYDEWIAEYRAGYSVSGKTLSAYRAEALVSCGLGALVSLQEELEQYGYVPLDEMQSRIAELQNEKILNETKIEALRDEFGSGSSSASDSAVAEMIAELVVRNVQIDSEITALTEENITSFDARVNDQFKSLQTAANNLKSVTAQLYRQETKVHFATNRAVITGDTSLAVVAVAGVVFGAIIACIVVCCIEYRRGKRAEEKKEAPEDDGKES